MVNVLTRFKSLLSFNPCTSYMLQKHIPNVPPLSPFGVTVDSGTPGFPPPRPQCGFALPPREQSSCKNNGASE